MASGREGMGRIVEAFTAYRERGEGRHGGVLTHSGPISAYSGSIQHPNP